MRQSAAMRRLRQRMTNLSTQSGRANSFVVTPPDFGLALAQCRPVGGRFLMQLPLLFEVRSTIRVRRRVIQHCNSTPRPNAISVCADLASEEQRRGPRKDGRRSDRFDRGVVLEIASGARLLLCCRIFGPSWRGQFSEETPCVFQEVRKRPCIIQLPAKLR